MKADVIKLIPVKEKITINEITLLSVEDYNKYKDNIPLLKESWWLRSAGYHDGSAACVFSKDGCIGILGNLVFRMFGVRPVLRISNHNLKIKDEFIFKSYKWTVISKDLAICNSYIGKHYFREDWKAEDANNYTASDIKKYIEDWLYN